MRINHNIPALRALHQLDQSNGKLDKTLERLSSGLRINHAADDAAGLAITQKMDTQVRGLKQANRNAMDGISLIQTAEGALNEVHSMLQRIRELSVQVSNGTYDATDRKAVQDEVSQLQNEVQRISDDIEFNEMKLLNGDIDRRAFSTDADIADIVSMSDTVGAGNFSFNVSQLASKTADSGGAVTLFDGTGKSTVSGTININGEQVEVNAGDSTEEVFAQLRDLASRVDVNITIEPTAPFANYKQLGLEMNKFGPKGLTVTGDLKLLEGLGLDKAQFNPNSESVYATTSADLSSGLTGGTVFVNGVQVDFPSGGESDTILSDLRNANIPGVEFSKDSAGMINVYSKKPLVIKPFSASTPPAGATDDELTAIELASLQTTVADALSTTAPETSKSTASAGVDTGIASGVINVGSSVTVIVDDGDVASNYVVPIAAGMNDMSDVAHREQLLETLNIASAANGAAGGTEKFVFDEETGKIAIYNSEGNKSYLVASNILNADDINAAKVLGYETADVTYSKKFGNLGRNVQVDTAGLSYDDPSTSNVVEGFPAGTTVTTTGSDIVFESNDNFELKLVAGTKIGNVTMNLLETGPLDLQIGANEGQFMQIRIQNLSPRALGITDINLSTSEGAQEAIGISDEAITTISNVRSKLGAYQNRLEHTIANLDSASENMTASLSRILDADMAYEMSQFTQQNIIQQAGISMLAQANQRPQSLLQLLQG